MISVSRLFYPLRLLPLLAVACRLLAAAFFSVLLVLLRKHTLTLAFERRHDILLLCSLRKLMTSSCKRRAFPAFSVAGGGGDLVISCRTESSPGQKRGSNSLGAGRFSRSPSTTTRSNSLLCTSSTEMLAPACTTMKAATAGVTPSAYSMIAGAIVHPAPMLVSNSRSGYVLHTYSCEKEAFFAGFVFPAAPFLFAKKKGALQEVKKHKTERGVKFKRGFASICLFKTCGSVWGSSLP